MNMDRQESLTADIAVRKPRTGSYRKPRTGPHPFVHSSQQDLGCPLDSSPSGSPLDGEKFHDENGNPSRKLFRDWVGGQTNGYREVDCTSGGATSNGENVNQFSFTGEGTGLMHKDRSDSKVCNSLEKMDDGESRGELKIFQRREKRRDDWLADRDSTASDKKNRRDGDGSFENAGSKEERRVSSREESKYASRDDGNHEGSPEYERIKKLDKFSREKPRSEKSYRDAGYRDRGDRPRPYKDMEHRNRTNHFSKDWGYRDRNDYSSKDCSRRDRGDYSYNNQRDRGGRNHYRDGDHQKYRRLSDDREKDWRPKDDQRYSSERHRSQPLSRSAPLGQNQGRHERNSFEKSSDHHREKSSFESRSPAKLKQKVGVGGITHITQSDRGRQTDVGKHVDKQRIGVANKRSSPITEPNKRRQRLILQENSDDEDEDASCRAEEHVHEPSMKDMAASYCTNVEIKPEVNDVLQLEGVSRLHISIVSTPLEPKETSSQPLQGVRKSSRVPKKRVLDGDEDEEIEPKRRRRRKTENDSDEEQYQVEEDEEKDEDFAEDDFESIIEDRPVRKRRRQKRVEPDVPIWDVKREAPLTARQRTLQSSKEGGDGDLGASLIEFPEGLTHTLPKKQKEILTEAERQLKKEEAARRRRQQVEKTVKESQAVAIQKILGQDSQRKKREDKLQKQREEMEQERKAAAMAPASNSIRWIMGPSGTVVSFSQDMELPKIFSGPCSYPPEREKCAAPSCSNAYKYRDSKSHLPLCSLQCFRAVQKPLEVLPAH